MVVSPGNQPPSLGVVQKSLHSHNRRLLSLSKGFRSFMAEIGTKTKYILLTTNHSITVMLKIIGVKTRAEALRLQRRGEI